MRMRPLDTASSPAMSLSVVDFPQPEGPRSTSMRPSAASKLTSSTARMEPQSRLTCWTEIADNRPPLRSCRLVRSRPDERPEYTLADARGSRRGDGEEAPLARHAFERVSTPVLAADRPGRAVEGGEHAVAGRVDLPPAEAPELPAHSRVVAVEQRPPAPIADGGSALGGGHDVRKEHGGEDPVQLRVVTNPGEELLDLVQDRVTVSEREDVVIAGQFD